MHHIGKIVFATLFLIAVAVWLVGPSYLLDQTPYWAGVTLFGSAMVMLAVIIASPINRLLKGFGLIIIAVLTTVAFKAHIEPRFSASGELILVLKALLDLVCFVCAGAGGSLIAVEGDRNATEKPLQAWQAEKKPNVPAPQAPIDYSSTLHSFEQKLADQTRVIEKLTTAIDAVAKQQRQSLKLLWLLGFNALIISLVFGVVAIFAQN